MKIRILDKCYTGISGNMFKGEEYDFEERMANKLIVRGYAEEVKEILEANEMYRNWNDEIKKLHVEDALKNHEIIEDLKERLKKYEKE